LSFRRVNTFKGTVAGAFAKIQNSRKICLSAIHFGLALNKVKTYEQRLAPEALQHYSDNATL
jgi:hypothetical protein